ncbi:hypothetical protein NDU88_000629 [Pleurodeles waltl]|uniref:Reverse transcriptase RNase H-like domain-containing protein n=1 Tax=Pleurodeles waltl TaxID=8319 RepID=A0AAV7L8P6_PLEWA|nr:hypothetical protein NDU88_000629 [Pleurodeles waltl]
MDAWNGRAIFGSSPDVILEADASRWGWGARCGALSTGGRWSQEELRLHINCLELLAGSFAIRSLSPLKSDCCILLRMDNISAVRYVNKLGGTRSPILAQIAKEFWQFCLQHRISVIAEHLPGVDNTVADWNSRFLRDGSDWRLLPQVFCHLHQLWGPFSIDLFASRLNRQLPLFFSWRLDPEATATDAFLQDWSLHLGYAFPPFNMIPRVLSQVRRQRVGIALVTPLWRAQAWFPLALELLCDFPLLIPHQLNLLLDPLGNPHPLMLSGQLQLVAWKLSGDNGFCQVFQNKLQSLSSRHGPLVHTNDMPLHGSVGLLGVRNGIPIPLKQMSI